MSQGVYLSKLILAKLVTPRPQFAPILVTEPLPEKRADFTQNGVKGNFWGPLHAEGDVGFAAHSQVEYPAQLPGQVVNLLQRVGAGRLGGFGRTGDLGRPGRELVKHLLARYVEDEVGAGPSQLQGVAVPSDDQLGLNVEGTSQEARGNPGV